MVSKTEVTALTQGSYTLILGKRFQKVVPEPVLLYGFECSLFSQGVDYFLTSSVRPLFVPSVFYSDLMSAGDWTRILVFVFRLSF